MMNLIGGRVIYVLRSAVSAVSSGRPAIAWLDNGILLGCVLVALLTAAGVTAQPTLWLAGLFAALGGAQQQWRWRDRGIWQVPLLLVAAPGVFLDRRGAARHGALEPGPGAGAEPGAARWRWASRWS